MKIYSMNKKEHHKLIIEHQVQILLQVEHIRFRVMGSICSFGRPDAVAPVAMKRIHASPKQQYSGQGHLETSQ